MKKIKKFIGWAACIGAIAAVGYVGWQYREAAKDALSQKIEVQAEDTVTEETPSDELEAIINDPSFQAAIKLQARKIKAEREKVAETARHEAELERIETELENVRAEELKLSEGAPSFR